MKRNSLLSFLAFFSLTVTHFAQSSYQGFMPQSSNQYLYSALAGLSIAAGTAFLVNSNKELRLKQAYHITWEAIHTLENGYYSRYTRGLYKNQLAFLRSLKTEIENEISKLGKNIFYLSPSANKLCNEADALSTRALTISRITQQAEWCINHIDSLLINNLLGPEAISLDPDFIPSPVASPITDFKKYNSPAFVALIIKRRIFLQKLNEIKNDATCDAPLQDFEDQIIKTRELILEIEEFFLRFRERQIEASQLINRIVPLENSFPVVIRHKGILLDFKNQLSELQEELLSINSFKHLTDEQKSSIKQFYRSLTQKKPLVTELEKLQQRYPKPARYYPDRKPYRSAPAEENKQ